MLMSDSLGGSAKTLMFVNVSPTDHNIDESSNSLTYATRVRTIKNDISKNEASKDVMRLKRQVCCHVTVACVWPMTALSTSPSLLAAILHVLLQWMICYKAVSAMLACCCADHFLVSQRLLVIMLVSHLSKHIWGFVMPVLDGCPIEWCACDLQVEHWKEQAGLSPEKRQMVDLLDVQDERWKNPDLEQQSVYSPKI